MSVPYLGDFAEDATVYIPFNTFDSNDPQASVTATTLILSDIYVQKDGSATSIVTDGATIDIDVNAIAGSHMITIDTSAHADYSIGSDYAVRIEGATVDAGLINAFVGSFSIENRFKDVNVVTVSGTAQTANDNGLDINTLITQVGTAGAGLTNIGTIATCTTLTNAINAASIVASISGNVDGNVTGSVGSNLELGPAEVNTEVDNALNVTTYAEPAQGTPASTTTLQDKIGYLYKFMINDADSSGTLIQIYDAAGTTVDHKAITSEAGGTVTREEFLTGP